MLDKNGYRKNVGIILCNNSNKLLICKRYKEDSWQFPQGGVNKNESIKCAMFRELFEELGLGKQDVNIIGRSKNWLKYELPKKYQRKTNDMMCIGQKQIWFLLRLIADDSKICFHFSERPEFDAWEWVNHSKPLDVVIDFKKNVYVEILKQFIPILKV